MRNDRFRQGTSQRGGGFERSRVREPGYDDRAGVWRYEAFPVLSGEQEPGKRSTLARVRAPFRSSTRETHGQKEKRAGIDVAGSEERPTAKRRRARTYRNAAVVGWPGRTVTRGGSAGGGRRSGEVVSPARTGASRGRLGRLTVEQRGSRREAISQALASMAETVNDGTTRDPCEDDRVRACSRPSRGGGEGDRRTRDGGGTRVDGVNRRAEENGGTTIRTDADVAVSSSIPAL